MGWKGGAPDQCAPGGGEGGRGRSSGATMEEGEGAVSDQSLAAVSAGDVPRWCRGGAHIGVRLGDLVRWVVGMGGWWAGWLGPDVMKSVISDFN
jgi:hypothetical protein